MDSLTTDDRSSSIPTQKNRSNQIVILGSIAQMCIFPFFIFGSIIHHPFGPGHSATIPKTPPNFSLALSSNSKLPSSSPSPSSDPLSRLSPTTTGLRVSLTSCRVHQTSVAMCAVYVSCNARFGGDPRSEVIVIEGGGGG